MILVFCLISPPKQEATGPARCCGWEKPPRLVRPGEQSRSSSAFAILPSSSHSSAPCRPPHAWTASPGCCPQPSKGTGAWSTPRQGHRGHCSPPAPRVAPSVWRGSSSVAPSVWRGSGSVAVPPQGHPAASQAADPIAGGGRHSLPWVPGGPLGKRLVAKREFAPHATGGGAGASPGPAAEWRPCLSTRAALSGPADTENLPAHTFNRPTCSPAAEGWGYIGGKVWKSFKTVKVRADLWRG